MASNWDNQSVNDDGTVNGTYYIRDVIYETAYAIFNQQPVGNKHDVPTQVRKVGNRSIVYVQGQPIAELPTTWNRMTAATARGINCTSTLEWRTYDKPPTFMLKVYIKNA